jgi:hypothetical protein
VAFPETVWVALRFGHVNLPQGVARSRAGPSDMLPCCSFHFNRLLLFNPSIFHRICLNVLGLTFFSSYFQLLKLED